LHGWSCLACHDSEDNRTPKAKFLRGAPANGLPPKAERANGISRQSFLASASGARDRSKIMLRHSASLDRSNQFESHVLSPAHSPPENKK
jgi:hypothetical protein